VCVYRSLDHDFHIFIKKSGNNNSESGIKKEESNFMWRLEHEFSGNPRKITRIKKFAAVVEFSQYINIP
jgi:hypothetical protein